MLPAVPSAVTVLALGGERSVVALVAVALLAWFAFYLLLRLHVVQNRQTGSIFDVREQLLKMWGLFGLLGPEQRLLPALGDHALDARRSYGLLWEVAQREPDVVVELGPGASTVLLNLLRESVSTPFHLYAVEHDEAFVEMMRSLLAYHEIDDVNLIEAPLEFQRFGEWSGQWYSLGVLAEIPEKVDFLVVDGPPGRLGPQSRYPALPALRDRLSDGAVVFVDDAGRQEERRTIAQWLQDDPALQVRHDGRSYVVLTMTRRMPRS